MCKYRIYMATRESTRIEINIKIQLSVMRVFVSHVSKSLGYSSTSSRVEASVMFIINSTCK